MLVVNPRDAFFLGCSGWLLAFLRAIQPDEMSRPSENETQEAQR